MFIPHVALMLALTFSQTSAAPAAQGSSQTPSALSEELWDAARAGDAVRVKRALENGADINARSRYGATALTFAADKGHVEIVTLLLDKGADPNMQDAFYKMRPLDMAAMNNHTAVARLLLERGSKGGRVRKTGRPCRDHCVVEKKAASLPGRTVAPEPITPIGMHFAFFLCSGGCNGIDEKGVDAGCARGDCRLRSHHRQQYVDNAAH